MKGLPELFDLRVKARSLAYLFAAGAVVGVLTFLFPPNAVRELELGITWGIALVLAIGLWARADRVREWHLYALLAFGTVLLTFANYYAGVGALYALLFSWIALYAFYFFELRAALVYVVLIAIGYTVILSIQHTSSSVIRWLLAVGTPTVSGLLISRLHERLRVEAAAADERGRDLRRSESRTRLVLDSAPDAFVAIDGSGAITTWNAAAERMFGWSAGEVVGRPLREVIFPPEGRDGHEQRRQELAEAGDPVRIMRMELDLQRRDGSTFPAEEVISRVRLGDDYVTSGFIRDISERQRRQEEREALMREQAARAEAERVAEMVSGMQLLVDAALAHRGIDDILADLVARVRGVLGADAATIFLTGDHEQLVVRATSAGALGDERPEPIAFGDRFAGRVASLREPLLAQDPDPADVQDLAMGELDIDSLIGVPLLAEGTVTGVLVTGVARPRRFTAEDLNLLRLAADRVALAIMHAQVYEREHRIAETLQRSLLPERLPQVPGLAAAARYLPAATEAEVGGDWYDVIPIPGGGVGLVMGDVAGKGLAAASMVGRLRSALRAYALEGHDPARVVEQLNRLVWTEAEESQMATLLYLIVDPANDQVRWVNAGHPPPLLVQDGSGEPVALPRGRALGAAGGAAVPELRGGRRAVASRHDDRALHRRARGAAGRSPRPRPGPTGRGRARRARRSGGALRPRARPARAGGRGARRRGAAGAPEHAAGRPLPRRVPDPARGARVDAQPAAPLAAPDRRQRAGDRGDHHRLWRGGDQRDRARRRQGRHAVRDRRPLRRRRGRHRRARLRRLASSARGRSGARSVADASLDGRRGGAAEP